ncbi:MAG: 5-oxoprolinase subunit PxpB [Zoogloea sp.]|nr:5-oxoprolinase subunit PxpB [Zoogloea sp.]
MSGPAAGFPRLLALGDAAFTVEFGAGIAPETHARVLGFAAALADCGIPGVIELVPTFRSVTVHVDPDHTDPQRLAADLLALALAGHEAAASGRRWVVPVCFDDPLAPDLPDVAAHCGLSREVVIERLTGTEFSVYMLGFLPGFAYLGGLPAALEMPRLATPRTRVPAGSLAIAGRMAAVYPWDSPGGWRLVGRTGVGLFDAGSATRPALLAPGDRVRFRAVASLAEAAEALQEPP